MHFLFLLIKKETKKSSQFANLNLFLARKAHAIPPKKLPARIPAPSLKKYAVLFLYARPCTELAKQPCPTPSFRRADYY